MTRLKELANDRLLIEELALSTVRQQRERFDNQKALLALQEAEVKKLKLKVNNLMEAIADETDRTVRASLGGKLRELQTQLAHSEAAILEKQSTDGGSVADVSSVFTILKAFKNGFEKVDLSLQAEILRDVVAEIEVQREGVLIKIFGLSGGNLAKKRPAVCRSGVRTVYDLVDVTGIEPATLNMPC